MSPPGPLLWLLSLYNHCYNMGPHCNSHPEMSWQFIPVVTSSPDPVSNIPTTTPLRGKVPRSPDQSYPQSLKYPLHELMESFHFLSWYLWPYHIQLQNRYYFVLLVTSVSGHSCYNSELPKTLYLSCFFYLDMVWLPTIMWPTPFALFVSIPTYAPSRIVQV